VYDAQVSGSAAGEFRMRLKERLRPTYRSVRRVLTSSTIERRLGIETSRYLRPADLGLDGIASSAYEPSPWLTLRLVLPRASVSSDDVFLDLGSGMGRVVYQAAARYPFRKVIGVELSEQLHAIAQANIDANRGRLGAEVELVCADALEYAIPPDVTVVYVYNAFKGDVFAGVISKLLASYDHNPRQLRLIYRTPQEHEYLIGTKRFRPIRTVPGLRPGREWSRTSSTRMYEVLPSRDGPSRERTPVGPAPASA